MNEPLAGGLLREASREDVPPAMPATAGQLIARLRTDAGAHLAAIAATLKVPVRKLEALEADQYDVFPDMVFVRALASSVCRTLKVDPAPVLALLPHAEPTQLAAPGRAEARFRMNVGRDGVSVLPDRSRGTRVVGPVVIVLLLAALVVVFWPRVNHDGEPAAGNVPSSQVFPAEESGETPASPASIPAPAPIQVPASAAAVPDAAEVVPVAPVPQTAASASAPAPVVVAPDPVPPLVIQARRQTWVQVRDAQDTILIQKNLEAGERFVATDAPPWSVVIGRADAADVTVRGESMDLAAVARSNVARFEVK